MSDEDVDREVRTILRDGVEDEAQEADDVSTTTTTTTTLMSPSPSQSQSQSTMPTSPPPPPPSPEKFDFRFKWEREELMSTVFGGEMSWQYPTTTKLIPEYYVNSQYRQDVDFSEELASLVHRIVSTTRPFLRIIPHRSRIERHEVHTLIVLTPVSDLLTSGYVIKTSLLKDIVRAVWRIGMCYADRTGPEFTLGLQTRCASFRHRFDGKYYVLELVASPLFTIQFVFQKTVRDYAWIPSADADMRRPANRRPGIQMQLWVKPSQVEGYGRWQITKTLLSMVRSSDPSQFNPYQKEEMPMITYCAFNLPCCCEKCSFTGRANNFKTELLECAQQYRDGKEDEDMKLYVQLRCQHMQNRRRPTAREDMNMPAAKLDRLTDEVLALYSARVRSCSPFTRCLVAAEVADSLTAKAEYMR